MYDETKYFYIKTLPLFSHLKEQQIMELSATLKIKQVYRGEVINYGSGEFGKIFFLVKGKIKITEIKEPDNELVKDILAEGDIFGDMELEGYPKDDEFAEPLTANTIICYFTVGDFRRLLELNPLIALNYAKQISGKLKRVEDRHSDLVFRDAKSRLIRFIKDWARTDGSKVGDKIVLNNYLTHSDIAAFICTSRQSVNILLNELRDSGLLHYNRKKIELTDPLVWN
jgi:CRP/FNR family transcriptional regulator, cyclic AMP receptor protein